MKRLEDFLQYKCAEWLRSQGILFFHVPNAAKRSLREASRLKAMGMVSGVHDLVILLDNGKIIFVELKTDKGDLSPKQKLWHAAMVRKGFHHHSHLIAAATHEQAVAQLAAIVQSHS